MKNEQETKQINIEITDEVAEGIYSNLAIVAHSSSEFVLDFVRIMPSSPKAKVKSRIIMTPEHAKRLLMALQQNVSKFEEQFGSININNNNNPKQPFPMGFGGFKGEA